MQAINISETGRRAFAAGLKPTDNPFAIGSQARSLWAKGYRAAKADAQAKKPRQFSSCTVMRRKLIRHGILNFATGGMTPGNSEWVTEPCNVPLFDDEGRATGKCRSCRTGWTHEHNYPVETP